MTLGCNILFFKNSLQNGGSGGIMTTARPELPYPCTFMLFTGQVYGQYFSVGYERTSTHVFS